MIWLLQALGWLKGALNAVMALVTRYPLQCALGAALALVAWTWHGWGKEKAAHKADIAAYVAAQKQAVARQEQADQTNFAGQLAAIKQQDAAHAQFETARNDAAGRFIAGHRMPAQTCRPTSGPGVAPVHPDSAAPVDGSAPGNLVTVKPADIDAWSKVELQNAERGGFLRGLVEQGLAIPAGER